MIVRKVNLADISSSIVYSTTSGATEPWFSWMYPMSNGMVRAQDINCQWPVSTHSQDRCSATFR